jgi:hypothetical protein
MSSSQHPPSESVGDVVAAALRGEVHRRDFLRRVVLAGLTSSAAYQLLDETGVAAQQPSGRRFTTMALGEEGNPPQRPDIKPGRPLPQQPSPNPPGQRGKSKLTTYAIGEEDSKPPKIGKPSRPKPTTLAVGEEQRGIPTTGAVGEEQSWSGPGKVTTHKLGEESKPPRVTPPTHTTKAVGEESPPRTSPSKPSPFPNYTTRAFGEEGRVPSPPRGKTPQLLERLRTPWRGFRRW